MTSTQTVVHDLSRHALIGRPARIYYSLFLDLIVLDLIGSGVQNCNFWLWWVFQYEETK